MEACENRYPQVQSLQKIPKETTQTSHDEKGSNISYRDYWSVNNSQGKLSRLHFVQGREARKMLLHNFFQQSVNPGDGQVQILLAGWLSISMVRTSHNSFG